MRMSSTETEEKKEAPPVNIGWDSHKPVVSSYYYVIVLR